MRVAWLRGCSRFDKVIAQWSSTQSSSARCWRNQAGTSLPFRVHLVRAPHRGVFVLWPGGTLHLGLLAAAKRAGSSVHAGVLARTIYSSPSLSRVTLTGTLLCTQEMLPLSLLADSGDLFIDESLARQAGLPLEALSEPKTVS